MPLSRNAWCSCASGLPFRSSGPGSARVLAGLFSLLACGWLLFASKPAFARTWRVSPDGTGDFTTIQAAIDRGADLDTILVSPGIYREKLFFGQAQVRVVSTDGPRSTVIDADSMGTAVTMVLTPGPDTVLDGFTIRGGTGTRLAAERNGVRVPREEQADAVPDRARRELQDRAGESADGPREDRYGGGILISSASPTLRNLIVTGNGAEVGGGLYVLSASPDLSDCRFTGNVAGVGAGTAIEQCEAGAFRRCSWEGNQGASGGAVCVITSVVEFERCEFSGDLAGEGGALRILGRRSSPVLLRGCLIHHEIAQDGAAVWARDAGWSAVSCTFAANGSAGASRSAIHLEGDTETSLEKCIVAGNSCAAPFFVSGARPRSVCCDFWDPTIPGGFPPPGPTDFSLDPRFCLPEAGDFRLRSDSPCTPEHSPHGCGLVGALGEGCGPGSRSPAP